MNAMYKQQMVLAAQLFIDISEDLIVTFMFFNNAGREAKGYLHEKFIDGIKKTEASIAKNR